jgi:hypothetical protein
MRKESALPGGSLELDKWNNSPELQLILQITWKLTGDLKNYRISVSSTQRLDRPVSSVPPW